MTERFSLEEALTPAAPRAPQRFSLQEAQTPAPPLSFGPGTQAAAQRQFDDRRLIESVDLSDARLPAYTRSLVRALQARPNPQVQADVAGLVRQEVGGQVAPDPFYAQSFTDRNIRNPLMAGTARLQQGAGVGGASTRVELFEAFRNIESLVEQGRPQDALDFAQSVNMPEVSRYAVAVTHGLDAAAQAIRERTGAEFVANINDIQAAQERLDEIPQDPNLARALQSGEIGDLVDAVLNDPGIITRVGLESLPIMAPGLAATPFVGPVAGLGGGSLVMERNLSMLEALRETAGEGEMTAERLAELFQDPAALTAARQRALARGVPIAMFDAFSAGLASRVIPLGATTRLGRESANLAAQTGAQGVAGAGGEAAAQVVAGQPINPAEIALEGVAEFASAPVEVAGIAAGGGRTAVQPVGAVNQVDIAPQSIPAQDSVLVGPRDQQTRVRVGDTVAVSDGQQDIGQGQIIAIEAGAPTVRLSDGREINAGAANVRPIGQFVEMGQAPGQAQVEPQLEEQPPAQPGDEWEALWDDGDPPTQIGWYNPRTRETRPLDNPPTVSRETAPASTPAAPTFAPTPSEAPTQPEITNAPVRAPERDPGAIPQSGNVEAVPVSSLRLDPETFQFRDGPPATRSGPLPAQPPPILVFETEAGERFVADGQQRVERNLRVAVNREALTMPAQIVREADGFTAEDVRALAALRNTTEGTAPPEVVAQLVEAGVTPESVEGLPQSGPAADTINQGVEIARQRDAQLEPLRRRILDSIANQPEVRSNAQLQRQLRATTALAARGGPIRGALTEAARGLRETGDLAGASSQFVSAVRGQLATRPGAAQPDGQAQTEQRAVGDQARFARGDIPGISQKYVSERDEIVQRIFQVARSTFGTQLNVGVFNRLTDGRGQEVFGAFERRPIPGGPTEYFVAVSLSERSPDPLATLNHEGIHYLREAGAFSDRQWGLLQREATRRWRRDFNIDQRYPRADGQSAAAYDAMANEEAVAEAYAAFVAGRLSGSAANNILRMIQRFLGRIANMLRGMGYTTWQDVFADVEAGALRQDIPTGTTESGDAVRYQRDDVLMLQLTPGEADFFDEIRSSPGDFADLAEAVPSIALSEDGRLRIALGDFERLIGYVDDVSARALTTGEKIPRSFPGGGFVRKVETAWRSSRLEQAERSARTLYQRAPALDLPDQGIIDTLRDGNASLLSRLRGGVSRSAVRASTDNFRTLMQDRFLPLKRIQDAIAVAEGKPLADAENAYLAEEGYSSKAGERLLQIKTRFKDPILEIMRASNLSIDQVDNYLYARHAPERNAQIARINPHFPDGGSGMTNADAAAIVQRAQADGTIEPLNRIAEIFDAMNAAALQTRVDLGLISEEDAAVWRSTYQRYAPLRGRGDIESERASQGRGYSITGQESQRALGRSSRAGDILAHAFMQAEEAAIRGEKNRVGQTLFNLATNHPYPELWQVNPIERRAVLSGVTGMVEYRDAVPMGPGEMARTVRVKVNGEPMKIRLENERLARQFNNLDVQQMQGLMGLAAGFNRFLSSVNTGYNPEFIITNAARDIQAGTINLAQYDLPKLRRNTLRDYPRALKAAFGGVRGRADTDWQREFRDFAANGGKVSFFRLDDVQRQRTSLERELRQMAQSRVDPRRLGRAFVRGVELTNQAIDNAIRLSAFVNAKRAGMTPQQAASLAKNLTVNFNRRGEWGQAMNALYLFYNAGIQGTAVIMGAMKSRKVRRLVYGVITAGFLSEMLNSMLSAEEEDGTPTYDRISDFEKSRNMIITLPGGTYIRIPMPYGYNAFWELGRNIAAYVRGSQSLGDSMGNVATTALDAFNPVGGADDIASIIAPTFADPVIDLATNDDFAGRQIMPERLPGQESMPSSQLYWGSDTRPSVAVARALNDLTGGNQFRAGLVDVSPEAIDHLFGFFTGAAGSFVRRAAELPGLYFSGDDMTVQDVPFVRTLVRQVGPWTSRSEFYERRDIIEAAYDEVRGFAQQGNSAEAQRAMQENQAIVALRPFAQRVNNALRQLRDARETIEANDAMADDVRQQRLDQIEETERQLLNQFNGQWLQTIVRPRLNF